MLFYTYPKDPLPLLTGYIMLDMEGPPLTPADGHCGLLLLDATWRYAAKMTDWVEKNGVFEKRSIPAHFVTAYPRRQDDCSDPARGLASVEALYLAYMLMDRDTAGILDNYFWKDNFLMLNHLEN